MPKYRVICTGQRSSNVYDDSEKCTPNSFFAVEQGETDLINVAGNPNIIMEKINFKGNPHPHHQGVYGLICLASGKYVFLSGDTTYEGIPEDIREKGFDFLQVCHHGGDYYLPPAVQEKSEAQQAIPVPNPNAHAIYSADGIHYGHPNSFFMKHHRNRGYSKENEVLLHIMAKEYSRYI